MTAELGCGVCSGRPVSATGREEYGVNYKVKYE